jgi:hypothetical protein
MPYIFAISIIDKVFNLVPFSENKKYLYNNEKYLSTIHLLNQKSDSCDMYLFYFKLFEFLFLFNILEKSQT